MCGTKAVGVSKKTKTGNSKRKKVLKKAYFNIFCFSFFSGKQNEAHCDRNASNGWHCA
jgi:hypothetical protein